MTDRPFSPQKVRELTLLLTIELGVFVLTLTVCSYLQVGPSRSCSVTARGLFWLTGHDIGYNFRCTKRPIEGDFVPCIR